MMKCTIVATTAGDKPLQALADLVEKRSKYLRETVRYSVGAIAIDALKHIRTATRRYSGRGKAKVA